MTFPLFCVTSLKIHKVCLFIHCVQLDIQFAKSETHFFEDVSLLTFSFDSKDCVILNCNDNQQCTV